MTFPDLYPEIFFEIELDNPIEFFDFLFVFFFITLKTSFFVSLSSK